jgi:AraC-like DNA-binding protein
MSVHAHVVVEESDVGAAEAALAQVYLPLRLKPHRGGDRVHMRLDAAKTDRITLGSVHFGVDMRIITEEAAHFHVDIPLAGRCRSRSGRGTEVLTSVGSAAVFMPGAPADLEWTKDTEEMCLMADARVVEQELASLLGADVTRPLRFAERMELDGPAGHAWLQIVNLVGQESKRDAGLLHYPLTARRLEQILIDGLLVGHQHNYSAQLDAGRASPSLRAIRGALELVEDRPELPWTTGALAAEVGVSARALQSGFRGLTGKAPMGYLRDVRLRRAHDDLLDADPQRVTVSQVAHQWGFTHLGRFAADYERRYGTLPSASLRSSSSSGGS